VEQKDLLQWSGRAGSRNSSSVAMRKDRWATSEVARNCDLRIRWECAGAVFSLSLLESVFMSSIEDTACRLRRAVENACSRVRFRFARRLVARLALVSRDVASMVDEGAGDREEEGVS